MTRLRPRRRHTVSLPPLGKYDLEQAVMPAGEQLGEPTKTRQKHTRVAAVADPYDHSRRILAVSDIRTDLLESELAYSRISQAAFLVGREIQSKLEQQTRVGAGNQWNSGDRVDQYQQHELHIVRGLELAREIEAYFAWVGRCLGQASIDCKIIRDLLGDQLSYSACAAAHGRYGDRGVRYIAQRFRDALECLAGAHAAKGRDL